MERVGVQEHDQWSPRVGHVGRHEPTDATETQHITHLLVPQALTSTIRADDLRAKEKHIRQRPLEGLRGFA